MNCDQHCECGGVCERGEKKCSSCLRMERRRDALDESLRKQYDPRHTQPLFGDEETK